MMKTMTAKNDSSRRTKTGTSASGENLNGSGIRVIARAADVLMVLGQHPEGLTLREIADRVNLPRSTVQRIVKALDETNFVIAASPTSGVRLGPALISLGALAKEIDIVQICRPLLVELNKDCGETVHFSVLGNGKAVVVDQILGVRNLMAAPHIGATLHLHASATGKALLAEFPPAELASLRKRYRLAKFTANTIDNWTALEAELAQVRREGIAYDREESFAGISAVAKTVHVPQGEVGVVSIPVPKERFESTKAELARILERRCGIMERRFAPGGASRTHQRS
jgi:DNA-binding IclR family transcriptional regulator